MSSIPEIRHRIKVVSDTMKITRAMYLISSAKMKKAMSMHEKNLFYHRRVMSDMRFILENTQGEIHNKFFYQRKALPEERNIAYLVIAGDKGMCGGYNDNVLKMAAADIEARAHESLSLFTIGMMANVFFLHRGVEPDVDYLNIAQNPQLDSARKITQELCSLYTDKALDEIFVVYTHMESSAKLIPTVFRLLPILPEDFKTAELLHEDTHSLTYLPSRREVLNNLTPSYLIGRIYSALVQSYASEQCARMTSMDASTRNAGEMLDNLQLDLNRARQAGITQELTEIISGSGIFLK